MFVQGVNGILPHISSHKERVFGKLWTENIGSSDLPNDILGWLVQDKPRAAGFAVLKEKNHCLQQASPNKSTFKLPSEQ